jgi:GT2 family glycosyltransferase
VSVVIVSWNVRDLLVACLRSVQSEIARSTLTADVVVVDNASTDDTVPVLRAQFPDVVTIALAENVGFAAATNRGIRRAQGSTYLLLNPDTELLPGSLSTMHSVLAALQTAAVVGPLLLNPDRSVQAAGFAFPGLIQVALDLFPLHPRLVGSRLNGRFSPGDGRTPFPIDHPLGACMLARRSAIEQVGLLDEGYFLYSEEIDWCRRFRDAGWTVLTAPAARVVHHGGQSSRQLPERSFVQLHRSRARYFGRYHSPAFRRAVALLAAVRARYTPSDQRPVWLEVAKIYRGDAVDSPDAR